VPIEFTKIDQVSEEFFSAYEEEKNEEGVYNTFYNDKGRALNYKNEVQPVFNQRNAKRGQKEAAHAEKVRAGIKRIWPDCAFQEFRSLTTVVSPAGDTLVDRVALKFCHVIADAYLVHGIYSGRGYVLINKQGEQLINQKFKISVYEDDAGNTIVGEKVLIDAKGEAHFKGYDRVKYLSGTKNYYRAESKGVGTLIYDQDLNQIFDVPFMNIQAKVFEDKTVILVLDNQKTILYDSETKQMTHLPFLLKSVRYHPNIWTFEENGSMGCYDINRNKIVVDPIYAYVRPLSKDLYLAMQVKLSRKEKNKLAERKILDREGSEVFSANCRSISQFRNTYFRIVNPDTSETILDHEMNELMTFPKGQKVQLTAYWAVATHKGKKRGYPIDRYLKGDRSIWFDYLPTPVDKKEGFQTIYKVKKEGKIGFADEQGNLLHPCELEAVDGLKGYGLDYKGYFMALKNGKWGVLTRPRS